MSKYVWGPILDSDLMRMDDVTSIMNRRSDFYPYDVIAELDKNSKPISYTIEVALAGIKREEISVQLTDEGGLSIEVTPDRKSENNIRVLRNNISYAKKSIVFDLTKDCDIKNIESKFVDGLLSIKIPMIVEKSKARQIKIG